jgi:hypothetical protein
MQRIKIILITFVALLLFKGCESQPYFKIVENKTLLSRISTNRYFKDYDKNDLKLYRIPVYTYGDTIHLYKLQPNFKAYLKPYINDTVYAIVNDNKVIGHIKWKGGPTKLNAHNLNVDKLESLFYCIKHNGLFYQEEQTTYFYMHYWEYEMKPRIKAAELFFAPINYYHDMLRNLELRDSLARELKAKGYQKSTASFSNEKWQSLMQQAIKTKYEPKFWQDTAPQNLRKEYKYRYIPTFRFTKDVLDYNRETDIRPFIEPDPYALSVIFYRDDTVFFRAEFDLYNYKSCQDQKHDPEIIPYEVRRWGLYVSVMPKTDMVDPNEEWIIVRGTLTKVENDTTYFFSFGVNNEIKPITNIEAEDFAEWINGSHYHYMEMYNNIKKWKKKYNYTTQE